MYVYGDGRKVEGFWLNDSFCVEAKYTFPNGKVYKGDYFWH